MKKKLKWVGAFCFVIVICFAYAHIDKMHSVYNEDVDPSLYTGSEVDSDEEFQQEFSSVEKNIDGIALKVNTTGENLEKVKLVYSVENENGVQISQGEVTGDELKNQKFNKLPVGKITNAKGSNYIFKCHLENNDKLNGVSILRENDKLVMKYYMSRFDLETFSIAVALCLYVIVFMKILFKMFKE